MDVDVRTTPDEIGVGAMLDPTVAEDRKIWLYLYLIMSDKENTYTRPKLQLIV